MGIALPPPISQVRAWPSGALLEAVVLTQREANGASAPRRQTTGRDLGRLLSGLNPIIARSSESQHFDCG